jgi:iron complex outermembrane recepter protein
MSTVIAHCRSLFLSCIVAALVVATLGTTAANAQTAPDAAPAATAPVDSVPDVTFDPITVTATRGAARMFDVPASTDVVDGATIRNGQPGINLSESLVRVPGLFAANRNNYAQDLQLSSRGFGARAAFGVRGVRLYQDDIPATMPDGQGQTGSFSLLSAQRIEVLRGPFSTLYGNASGGVVSVYTEDGTAQPIVTATASAGSYGTWIAGVKATGIEDGVAYVAAYSDFDTEGYRDHSAARRQIANAKLTFDMSDTTHVTLIASSQYQPQTQDPLGLTYAEWQANPRQADPVATLFNTSKTISQVQGGVAIDQVINADTSLRVTGYAGHRGIRQFLALTGSAQTSAGGVVDLDRDYGGIGARLIWKGALLDRPLTLNVGADTDRQDEKRQGFVNNNGAMGDLRRDEDDLVTDVDVYAEAQWYLLPDISVTLGVRASRVNYSSVDHYIVGANPDDSGARNYHNTSPVAGVVWHGSDNLNLYFSYGQGFETPTFAEIAYRTGGTGLNLALNPATSTAYELGMKWLPTDRQRINLAIFDAETQQEIVVDTATGGRTTYRNADRTRRRGVEAEWDADLGSGFTTHVNYTWLKAIFVDPYIAGIPPVVTPAGARLPGVPPEQVYGELVWTPGGYFGFNTGAEVQYAGRLYVNDRDTQFAPAYTLGNLRVGFAQDAGRFKISEYARLNNIANVNYVGSVIVGDTNGRYFEPSPGRNFYAGVSISAAF